MPYEVGSVYRASFTVTDPDTGNQVTPVTQLVTVTYPDQTFNSTNHASSPPGTLNITIDDVGLFHVDIPITQAGLHKVTAVCGTPVFVSTDYFNAAQWRSVVSLQDAKDYVNDQNADKDPLFRSILMAATEKVEDIVGVCVPTRYVNERVVGQDRRAFRVPHPPLLNDTAVETVTSVWSGGPIWTTDALIHYPDSGVVEPINMIGFWLGPWKVTYTAGRMVISESIQLAAKEIVYDLWSIHRAYGSDQLEPGPEDTARFETMVGTYSIPPHAKALLESETQPGFG